MNNKLQSGFAPIIIILVAGVTALGGTAAVVASDASKPGDVLHPIDQAVENIRLAVASPEAQEIIRVQLAEERIKEIQSLLQEKTLNTSGLDVALTNLTEQKQKIAQLLTEQKTKGISVEQKGKELDTQFELKEAELERIFEEAEASLKAEKRQLKVQLREAIAVGNTTQAQQLRDQIAQIEAQLDVLEAMEEETERLLEVEEEKLEAELEAQEEAQEEQEKLLEKQQEELEEQEEELREQAEEASEAERERLEEEAEEED